MPSTPGRRGEVMVEASGWVKHIAAAVVLWSGKQLSRNCFMGEKVSVPTSTLVNGGSWPPSCPTSDAPTGTTNRAHVGQSRHSAFQALELALLLPNSSAMASDPTMPPYECITTTTSFPSSTRFPTSERMSFASSYKVTV